MYRLSTAVVAIIAIVGGILGGLDEAAGGATLAAPLPTAPPKACPTDEAVGPVCVWDARHQGNGAGTSFVHYRGQDRHFAVSHRTAHQLQNRDNWRAVPDRMVGIRMDDLNGHGTIRIGRDAIVSFGDTTYVQVSKDNAKPRHIATS